MADYDLIIIGAGSGNQFPADAFVDWRVAIVEMDKFGGTCLQRGCIPSKMFAYTADMARQIRDAGRFGLEAQLTGVDWPAIRDRVFARIDPLHDQAVKFRRTNNIDVFLEPTHFVDPHTVQLDGRRATADRFVIATGSRPVIPDITGLSAVEYFTSDNIMRIDELPRALTIIGGGYIAAEMAHIFGALGTAVTILCRSRYLLSSHDGDIQKRFTSMMQSKFEVHLSAEVESVTEQDGEQITTIVSDGRRQQIRSTSLLIATGRRPNSDLLKLDAARVDTDEHGHIIKDDSAQTSQTHIWALGDVANHFQLKHMANAEASVVWHNLRNEQPRRRTFETIPAAVFAEPQVASAGETEEQLRARNASFVTLTRNYADAAYGWAMQDESSFVKVLVDSESRMILGAHIIGPNAAILLQPLVQAMFLDNTADEVAKGVIYLHPSLAEVLEQALLGP